MRRFQRLCPKRQHAHDGNGFDDGMNQPWGLEIAGEDWDEHQVSALIGHTGHIF
jgi:hypothetical protein